MSGVVRQKFVTLQDRPGLVLPNGKRADELRVSELFRELSALSVPGIVSTMPKNLLLDCYDAALTAQIEAVRRSGGPWHGPVSDHEKYMAAQTLSPRGAT